MKEFVRHDARPFGPVHAQSAVKDDEPEAGEAGGMHLVSGAGSGMQAAAMGTQGIPPFQAHGLTGHGGQGPQVLV